MTWRRFLAAVSAGTALGVTATATAATFLLYVEIADGRTHAAARLSKGIR